MRAPISSIAASMHSTSRRCRSFWGRPCVYRLLNVFRSKAVANAILIDARQIPEAQDAPPKPDSKSAVPAVVERPKRRPVRAARKAPRRPTRVITRESNAAPGAMVPRASVRRAMTRDLGGPAYPRRSSTARRLQGGCTRYRTGCRSSPDAPRTHKNGRFG